MRKKTILTLFFLISLLTSCNGPFYTKDPNHDLYLCDNNGHFSKDEKGFTINYKKHSYNLNGDCKTCNWKKKYNVFKYSENSDNTEAMITGYTGSSSYAEIPDILFKGLKIVSVYISNDKITHLKLNPNIKRISMKDSINLEEITNVTDGLEIGYHGFENCEKFKGFDGKIGKIDIASFRNCGISHIEFTDDSKIRYVPKFAFQDSKLKSIKMDNIIQVEESAFENCSELESIDFSTTKKDETLYIQYYGFKNCVKLKNVYFPKQSIVNLSKECFSNCKSLKAINIPYFLTVSENEQFIGCENLEEFDFEHLSTISSRMFKDTNMKSIKLGNHNFLKPYAFDGGVEEVYVTYYGEKREYSINGVDEIKYSPFPELSFSSQTLKKVTFSGKLYHTVFNKEMFRYCVSLESLDVPDGITELGESCFFSCYKLSSLVLPTSLQKIGDQCFTFSNKTKSSSRLATYEPIKIYYKGDKANWDKVTIGRGIGGIGTDYNGKNVYVDFHQFNMFYFSESMPTDKTLQYWHYVDGVPTSW